MSPEYGLHNICSNSAVLGCLWFYRSCVNCVRQNDDVSLWLRNSSTHLKYHIEIEYAETQKVHSRYLVTHIHMSISVRVCCYQRCNCVAIDIETSCNYLGYFVQIDPDTWGVWVEGYPAKNDNMWIVRRCDLGNIYHDDLLTRENADREQILIGEIACTRIC